jgi:hypothetical protein
MHIVSGVQGELAPGRDAFDLFAAAFPAGTLVGAPKVRAMEIIDELSRCGAASTAAPSAISASNGDMDQAITIRTLVFRGTSTATRPAPASWPTANPRVNTTKCWPRAPSCACAEDGAGRTVSTAQPRLLLIDNYDSFTYNLVQAFLVLGADVRVIRNDEISVEQALRARATHLCISPGPGTPHDAGVSLDMIRAFAGGCRSSACASGTSRSSRCSAADHGARAAADAWQDVDDEARWSHGVRGAE